ncbi:MAG: hypothetical protein KY476_18395 [Planctomycetes bacterium]|nr:hypothetical protein [Planctomycetota bacterium]
MSVVSTAAVALVALGSLCLVGCEPAVNAPVPQPAAESAASTQRTERHSTQAASEFAVRDLSESTVGRTVHIEGRVSKQCPAVGCWMIVDDSSGEIFVDLNPAGQRLQEERERQKARVVGSVVYRGGELQLAPESVEFPADADARSNP